MSARNFIGEINGYHIAFCRTRSVAVSGAVCTNH